MAVNLPIDVVPNTDPPRFRWRQVVTTPIGTHTAEHEGPLPPSLEGAVVSLVALVKQQLRANDVQHAQLFTALDRIAELQKQITDLQKQIEGHCERIAVQSELLTKRAEAGPAPVQGIIPKRGGNR